MAGWFKITIEIHDADSEGGERDVLLLQKQDSFGEREHRRPQIEQLAMAAANLVMLAHESGDLVCDDCGDSAIMAAFEDGLSTRTES